LKSDAALAHIPVIMATMMEDRPLGFALGASDFISKPIDQTRLRSVLSRLVSHCEGHVLIVEDDPASRDMLRRLLEKEGIATREAENGQEGLDAVAQEAPQLVMLDLMMPVMDGFDFLVRLRANEATRTIP